MYLGFFCDIEGCIFQELQTIWKPWLWKKLKTLYMEIVVVCFEKKVPYMLHEKKSQRKLARWLYHKLKQSIKASNI